MPRIPIVATAAAISLFGRTVAPAAHAAPAEEVVGGLVTPLSVAVDGDGTVYAAQNFAGLLTKAVPGAEPEVIHAVEGYEVGAVSVADGLVTFATTAMGPEPAAHVYTLAAEGNLSDRANLWSLEKGTNPDAGSTYGLKGLTRSCTKAIKEKRKLRGYLPYHGIKESHPYATAVDGDTIYVADAAANAIFSIDGETVDTVAVLPATKIKVTKKVRKVTGLPKCAGGKTLRVEGVPTDVEVGPDGNLYVTTLPGGPEDPRMGANGGLYRVSPTNGSAARLAGGLVSPTGLAIGADGTAYISMLFASRIMAVPLGGEPELFAEVPLPGDVEVAGGYVYATETDLMNDGSTPPAGKVLRWEIPAATN